MLSIVALTTFISGIVIVASGKAGEPARDIGRAFLWCGLLVLLLALESWHAIPMH